MIGAVVKDDVAKEIIIEWARYAGMITLDGRRYHEYELGSKNDNMRTAENVERINLALKDTTQIRLNPAMHDGNQYNGLSNRIYIATPIDDEDPKNWPEDTKKIFEARIKPWLVAHNLASDNLTLR
jgi:hypothetical protein